VQKACHIEIAEVHNIENDFTIAHGEYSSVEELGAEPHGVKRIGEAEIFGCTVSIIE
jgi:hypothetical protein